MKKLFIILSFLFFPFFCFAIESNYIMPNSSSGINSANFIDMPLQAPLNSRFISGITPTQGGEIYETDSGYIVYSGIITTSAPDSIPLELNCGGHTFGDDLFDYYTSTSTYSGYIGLKCSSGALTLSGGAEYGSSYNLWIIPDTTATELDNTPTYYDWLIMNGFILFCLSLIILYPIIKMLFPHKEKY